MKTNYVSPGSPTFEKAMLGAGIGSGSLLGADQRPLSPEKVIEDIALGSVAGNLALPLLTKGANSIMARGAGAANRIARGAETLAGGGGGIGGALGTVGTAAAGPLGQNAAKIAPAIAGILPGAQQQPQMATEDLGASPLKSVPTMQELLDSKDPYLKTIGQRLLQQYGGRYAFYTKPDGTRYTPDDIVKAAYEQTNGFAPTESAGVLEPNPANYDELKHDLQVAKAVNGIDWNNLDKWYKGMGEGGLGQVRGLAEKINLGKSRQAEQQLQELLLATGSSPVIQGQVERIMRLPNLDPAQKKQAVIQTLSSTPNVFGNAALLRSLGLLK